MNKETSSGERAVAEDMRDANTCLAAGAGITALGVGSAMTAGAVCPLCIVAAPALLGYGAWKRYKAGQSKEGESPGEER